MSDALQTRDPSAEALMGEIVDEFLERLGRGERPDVEEYARRYTRFAAILRQMLPAVQALHLSAANHMLPTEDLANTIEPEAVLGDFRIVREIGRGGMGIVYEAVQVSLGRRVALKVLTFAAALDAKQLQRFKNEAQAAAYLHHQHIVPVFAVGVENGVHYYVMQFIDGQTLAALIHDLRQLTGLEREGQANHRGPASVPGSELLSGEWMLEPRQSASVEAHREPAPAADNTCRPAASPTVHSARSPSFFRTVAHLAAQAAEALEHAHSLGVIHRDVKPANLLIDSQGNLWVTDLGLAQMQTDTRLTLTGDLVGTLRYMSPEQALAQPIGVDHRTDLYSLGATLYELLTLVPAFDGRDRQELLRQIAWEEPKPPRRINPAIPGDLETIALKAMAKNATERYATAQELANDLQRFLKDEPIRAKRPTLVQRSRKWARRHRPIVWSGALALLAALVVLAGSVGWIVRDQGARQAKTLAAVQAALEEARHFQAEANWPQAQAAAMRAEALLQNGAAEPDLAERIQSLLRELDQQEAGDRLVARLEELRLLQSEVDASGNHFVLERALPDYREAFNSFGLRADAMTPEEAAALLERQPPAVRGTMIAALDHWLILARFMKAPETDWLKHVLVTADPDAWRQRVRAARERNDRQALIQLANEVDAAAQPPEALFLLDLSLRQRGGFQAAVALLRRAQEAFPADFWINHNLGVALQECQPPQYEEAIRFLTVAAALRPQSPGVRLNLALALWRKGRLDEAIVAFRHAIALKPDYAVAHYDLGNTLSSKGRLDEAAAAFRRAIELRPNHAEAHCNLGSILRQQGNFTHALVAFEQGHELGSARSGWSYPSDQWVRECRRMIELEGRLPALLQGEVQPATAAERDDFAQLCFFKKHYVAAARLWADAFIADPHLVEDPRTGHREDAAFAAALAAADKGEDAGQLDDLGRSRSRKQALQWLRAELDAYAKLLESRTPLARWTVRNQLEQWQCEQMLAGLRDPEAVAKLSNDEQEACKRFWLDVEALHTRAGAAK